MNEEFPEYGAPLVGAAWVVGQMVWLRQASGPMLVWAREYRGDRVRISPLGAHSFPMIVPVERLAWSYREAVAA